MVLPWLRPKILAILAVVVVIAVVAVVFLPSVLTKNLSTQVIVTLPDGSQKTIFSDSAWPFTIVQYNGVTISAISWRTAITATSLDYKQYKILGLPSGEGALCGTAATCSSWSQLTIVPSGTTTCTATIPGYFFPVPATFTNVLNVGTAYDLGILAYGNADGTVIKFTASALISTIQNVGCPIIGYYTLAYHVQIIIAAIGQGSVPRATYAETVSTSVTLASGTISLTGTTTATASWTQV